MIKINRISCCQSATDKYKVKMLKGSDTEYEIDNAWNRKCYGNRMLQYLFCN